MCRHVEFFRTQLKMLQRDAGLHIKPPTGHGDGMRIFVSHLAIRHPYEGAATLWWRDPN